MGDLNHPAARTLRIADQKVRQEASLVLDLIERGFSRRAVARVLDRPYGWVCRRLLLARRSAGR